MVTASAGRPIYAPAWPTVVMPVRIGSSAVMKFGSTRRATCLGVIVREYHALLGELVEVWRLAGHQAAVVSADVPHANVIAHNHNDVGFFCLS